MIERTLGFPGPASPGHTLAPQRRGPSDPCLRIDDDGAIWRTSRQRSGPVTARIHRITPNTVDCRAWGEGAQEFVDNLPALLGADDDAGDFRPEHPVVAAAHRRVPHLRIGRTGRVLESLIPAVLEQRVPGVDAFRSWRLLVTKFGTPAPGPAPHTLRVPPPAEVWRRIPSWEFHRANVDPGRAGPERSSAAPSAPTPSSGSPGVLPPRRARRWRRCPASGCGRPPKPPNGHSATPTRCPSAITTWPP